MSIDSLNTCASTVPVADSLMSASGFVAAPLDTAMIGEGGDLTHLVTLTSGDSLELGLNVADKITATTEPPAWTQGIPGDETALRPGTDSSLLIVISAMLLLVVYSFSHCRNMISNFITELVDTRQRSNLFEEHTANEHSVVALLALQLSLCVGTLICFLVSGSSTVSVHYSLSLLLKLSGLYAILYVFRLCAYSVVGYTFTSRTKMRIWLQGFTASQSLLSLSLTVPTMVAIFFPQTASPMLFLAGILYILAEFVFIIKGFRIFYDKIQSLLYFILYLCTLEIIPIIALYRIAQQSAM